MPYSIAVISAPDAAGYGDFRRHLLENEYGFAFDVRLFEATMQGDTAPESIIAALGRIEAVQEEYDAVFIMRGGGSVLDLSCFDDYSLCAAIARFPLPVYTAIGHDRDVHVADMVACGSVKTPTALADLCIDAVAAEDERISSLESRLRLGLTSKIAYMETLSERLAHRVCVAFLSKIAASENTLSALATRIAATDPRAILSRGYALVTGAGGRIVKSAAAVNVGDALQIQYSDGKINCTVDGKI